MKFSPSGRFFAICGDSDFVIYQYPKFANAGFGTGNELVWASAGAPVVSQNGYAVKSESGTVKVYKNFSEHKTFKTGFTNEGIFGGRLLGIKSKEFITFYDWEQFRVVRRVDVSPAPKNVYWSDNGNFVVLALEETFYLLQYNSDVVEHLLSKQTEETDDGFEEAFTFIEEFTDTVSSGVWLSNECFAFTTPKGSINYLVTGSGSPKVLKLSNSDKKYFIMGYDGKQ